MIKIDVRKMTEQEIAQAKKKLNKRRNVNEQRDDGKPKD